MESNTTDQIINLIDKSQNILLLTHAKADCDGLGAMLALYLILNEMGKEITAVTNDPTPENLAFLPSISIVQNSLASGKDFIIALDITKTPLSKIKYNMEGDHVNIIITPKNGNFTKNDISFSQGGSKFDLIIVLDAGNLEHLGPIYDKNSELFFETPIINIDHHASNTDFGQVNMVDVVAASTTEVLYRILMEMEKKYDKKLITEDVATLLLAGIITDTGSFQHANTSPKSMEVAAKLLDLGGRQQEIIKNIYKTKKLSTLKLWGLVLSKVQVDPLYRMVWSTITKEDLQEADAESSESESIIDDLLSNAPGAEVIMLIKDNDEGYVSVSMRSTTNAVDVGKICADMGGGGHVRAAGYKVRDGRPFDQVVSEILNKVRKYQAERLNIHPEDITKKGEERPREVTPRPKDSPTSEGQPHVRRTAPQKEEKKPSGKSTYLEFKKTKSKPEKKLEKKPTRTDTSGKPESKPTPEPESKPAPKPTSPPPQPPAPAKAPPKAEKTPKPAPATPLQKVEKKSAPPTPKPTPAPPLPKTEESQKPTPQPTSAPPKAEPTPPPPKAEEPPKPEPTPPLDKSPEIPDWLKNE